MSAKHTPGLLHVDPKRSLRIATDQDESLASTGTSDVLRDSWEANARRLVACWNALIDLPQEALDGGWTRAGLEAHALKMEQQAQQAQAQRDELLSAIENILWNRKPGDRRSPIAILNEVEVMAKNAIAKVKGGAL